MAKAPEPIASPPKGWVETLRERVNGHWLMQEGRLPSIGRELAYAVEDIRHKVVEEGWFGRQVTPSTFPRADPPLALSPEKAQPGVHGEASEPLPGGPDIHGNGGPVAHRGLEGQILGPENPPAMDGLPAAQRSLLVEVEPAWDREALRLEFIEECRTLARTQLTDDRGPERGHDASPDR